MVLEPKPWSLTVFSKAQTEMPQGITGRGLTGKAKEKVGEIWMTV